MIGSAYFQAMSETPFPFLPWLGLFETLRVERGRPLFLEEHWTTFLDSRKPSASTLRSIYARRARLFPIKTGRWRWIATAEGVRDLFTEESPVERKTFSLKVSAQRLGSENWDARHKTLSYLTTGRRGRWPRRREPTRRFSSMNGTNWPPER